MEDDNAIFLLALLYSFLVLFGFITNSLIIAATFSSKSLQSTCNILIAFCSFSDIIHMVHLTLNHSSLPLFSVRSSSIWIFTGRFFMSSYLCNTFQAIPLFGLSAGTFGILSIGVDRLISVLFPTFYTSKNPFRYLVSHAFVIILYFIGQCLLILSNFEDKQVICSPPEVYHGQANENWAMISCIVYITSFIVYLIVWVQVRRKDGPNLRAFRSIFTVMVVVVFGWFTVMAGFLVVRLTTSLQGKDLYIAEELLGIPVNSFLCANYFVYFYLSADYRSIFRRQLRRVPILRDRFSSNNRTIKVSHTRSETIR